MPKRLEHKLIRAVKNEYYGDVRRTIGQSERKVNFWIWETAMEEIKQLQQRIKDLESEVRAFQRVNVELCQAVNSGKARQLLAALIAKHSE